MFFDILKKRIFALEIELQQKDVVIDYMHP